MPNDTQSPAGAPAGESPAAITRREAVWRVSALLGGAALVGGSSLLAACERGDRPAAVADGQYKPVGEFSAQDVALLDEIADTILPTTAKSPGAKAAGVGPFMALMVTDTYRAPQQQAFRAGMKQVDEATQRAAKVGFLQATPQQRHDVLVALDREAKGYMDRRDQAIAAAASRGQRVATGPQAPPEGTSQGQAAAGKQAAGDSADKNLSDQRQEAAGTGEAASGTVAADAPPHYFRMMKELALLGYFTSETVGRLTTNISGKPTERYVDTPGRYDPCLPYTKGEAAVLPHA